MKMFRTSRFLGILTVLMAAQSAFADIAINKDFSVATIYPGQPTQLTLTLSNSSLVTADAAAVTDSLPAGMSVVNLVSNTCGGTVTANPGDTQVVLTGGTIPAGDGANNGTCVVEVDVVIDQAGNVTNTIAAGDLTATTGGIAESNALATEASVAVIVEPVTIQPVMVFAGTDTQLNALQGFEVADMVYTLTNTNPVPVSNVGFQNSPGDLQPTVGAVGTSSCGGTVVLQRPPLAPGDSQIELVGAGPLAPGATCEVRVPVELLADPTDPTTPFDVLAATVLAPNTVTTNEGATNVVETRDNYRLRSGLLIGKGHSPRFMNIAIDNTTILTVSVSNYNAAPVPVIDLVDPIVGGTNLNPIAIVNNTCGGAVSITPDEARLTGGSLPPIPTVVEGIQRTRCSFQVELEVLAAGQYPNVIPAGETSGFRYRPANQTLFVSDQVLGINKTTRSSNGFGRILALEPGGDAEWVIQLTNLVPADEGGLPITNLGFTDSWAEGEPGNPRVFVLPAAIATPYLVNCGPGNVTAPPGGTEFTVSGVSIAPGERCEVRVPVGLRGDAPGGIQNTLDGNQITFDYGTATGLTRGGSTNATIGVRAVEIRKRFNPDDVRPLETIRLGFDIRRGRGASLGLLDDRMIDFAFTDVLPAGMVIADTPNVTQSTACGGGTVSAPPGGDTISFSNGTLPNGPGTNANFRCTIGVDVVTPPLSSGLTTEDFVNTIADASGRAASDGGEIQSFSFSPDTVRISAAPVALSKAFLDPNIAGGGASRVRISFANTRPNAAILTGVGVTDDLPTNVILAPAPNPTFTDTNGTADANGCRGGTFTATPGADTISLSGAEIDPGAICYFEFDVVAVVGGNWTNEILTGAVVTDQGVTNDTVASATLGVSQNMGVSKVFAPNFVIAGEPSDLTIEVYNTAVADLNDPTLGTEFGNSPVLVDVLPAGLTVLGTPTTTCTGATVTVDNPTNGDPSSITLNGGQYPPEQSCQVFAQVTGLAGGDYTNVIEPFSLSFVSGRSNPNTATTTLTVAEGPVVAKAFDPAQIFVGDISRVTLTIDNLTPATVAAGGLTNVSLTDDLVDMRIADTPNVSTTCAGLTPVLNAGDTSLSFSGFDLAPGATCQIAFDVTSDTPGQLPNTTSPIFSDQTPTGGAPSNTAILTVLPRSLTGLLTLEKTTTASRVIIGQRVPYTITVRNNAAFDISPATVPLAVLDTLPAGLSFVAGSAAIDGVPFTPDVSGQVQQFADVTIPAGGAIEITLAATVLSSAPLGELTNVAQTIDPVTGADITARAYATIVLRPEAVFHCSDVIGKVFDDRNMNGYQDPAPAQVDTTVSSRNIITDDNYVGGGKGKITDLEPPAPLLGEPGIPGVRVVTQTGTIITTDAFGRFSVPCAALPDSAGENFSLKVDTRSLPTGYRLTTENPRTMRVTPGIMTEMNFGAAIGRTINIDLTDRAFLSGEAQPSARLTEGVERLLGEVRDTPAFLRITYFRNGETDGLVRARLNALEEVVDDWWSDNGRYRLSIERTIQSLQ